MGVCSIDGCDRAVKTRGWCDVHYKRWWRYGDPNTVQRVRRPVPPDGLCVIPGCGQPHRTRGWCAAHYSKWRKCGDPLADRTNPLMQPDGRRRCVTCKQVFDLTEFYKARRRTDGLTAECRTCIKANYTRWCKANPDKVRALEGRKRARKRRLPNEDILPTVVFERDGWMCKLCDGPLDRDQRAPHPLSPSIDHIVPLAVGGSHLYENVQAAHLGCNVRKGARTAV